MNFLITSSSLSCLLTLTLMSCNSSSDPSQTAFSNKVKSTNSPVAVRQQTSPDRYSKSKVKPHQRGKMLNSEQIISAQVIPIASSGARIDGNTLITAQNINTYRPSEQTVQKVSAYFKQHGFEVSPLTGISFTISASAKHFTEFFKTAVTQDESGRILAGDRLEMKLDSVEKNIADSIASVTFVPLPDFGPSNF
jgi:subtilase family serine protease